MTRASANSNSVTRWSKDDFIRRTYMGWGHLQKPPVYEPSPKEPGSKVLQLGQFVEVE